MKYKKTLNIHTGCSPQHRMMTKTIKLQVAFTAHLRVLISHHPFSHFIPLCYFRPLVHENHDADLKDNETLTVSQSKKKSQHMKKALCRMRRKPENRPQEKEKTKRGLVWSWCEWPQMRGREKEGKGITEVQKGAAGSLQCVLNLNPKSTGLLKCEGAALCFITFNLWFKSGCRFHFISCTAAGCKMLFLLAALRPLVLGPSCRTLRLHEYEH